MRKSESTPIPFTPLRRHLDGALHIPRLELRGAEVPQRGVYPHPAAGALEKVGWFSTGARCL